MHWRRRIRSRRSWQAQPPKNRPTRVPGVRQGYYQHHSVTLLGDSYFAALEKLGKSKLTRKERRATKQFVIEAEKSHMRYLQGVAFGRGFSDISYNHVVFPSGNIYRGRGWEFLGAHNDDENTSTLGLCAVGNYEVMKPTQALIQSCIWYFKKGRRLGRVKKGFFIRGHRDSDATACPGKNLYAALDDIREEVHA
jgi:hypothetical protein